MSWITERDDDTHAVRLETDRLVLREHAPGDLNALHAMLSDPATIGYIPDMYKADIAEVSAYLHSVMRDGEQSQRFPGVGELSGGKHRLPPGAGKVRLHPGLLKRHTWHDGQWKDCAVYGILKDS